jgi:recombination protein RecA
LWGVGQSPTKKEQLRNSSFIRFFILFFDWKGSEMKASWSGALGELISSFERRFGVQSVSSLGKEEGAGERGSKSAWSSGIASLDRALGTHGYPKGRMIEIFGQPSVGKSTLALYAAKACQAAGGRVAYLDIEHTFDPLYARMIGVDLGELLLLQPQGGEQAFSMMDALLQTQEVGLMILDSVAALLPQGEMGEGWQTASGASQASLLSRSLRRLSGILYRTPTTLLFLNQIRYHLPAPTLAVETTPGGYALKFYASQRIELIAKQAIKDPSGGWMGHTLCARVVKNKMARPFQEASMQCLYGIGLVEDDTAKVGVLPL